MFFNEYIDLASFDRKDSKFYVNVHVYISESSKRILSSSVHAFISMLEPSSRLNLAD